MSFARVEGEAVYSEERTPGIGGGIGSDMGDDHAYSTDGGGVRQVVDLGMTQLRMLIVAVESALPTYVDPSNVPIYLGATAGMRIIEPNIGNVVLSRVRTLLRESNFMFDDDDWARIISGEEEGAYDWLVANYLANDGCIPRYDARDYDDMRSLRGALDLGGASVQVSYLASSSSSSTSASTTKKTKATSTDDERRRRHYPLRIGADLEYPVYTRSLLDYGVDRGRARYDMEFVMPSSSASSSSSLSSSSSSNRSHHGGDDIDDNGTNPCYPIGYYDPTTNITGSSDWDRCLHGVSKLFDRTASRGFNCGGSRGGGEDRYMDEDCHDDTEYPIIDRDRKFIAMSAFVYIWDYLGLKIGNETDDLLALETNARRVCGMNMTQQSIVYERHAIDNDITGDRRTNKPHFQCFNAAFAYHLLSTSFGLPLADTPIEIYYDIGGTKVQWALGLMLVEANKQLDDDVVSHDEERAHTKAIVGDVGGTARGLVAYFIFILLASMIALWRFRRRRLFAANGHLPLVDPDGGINPDFSPRKGK
jgi:hypothetical protein